MDNPISWSDFEKIDLRIGTITEVVNFEKSRNPSWILYIDFGLEIGLKKSSAQLKTLYKEKDLLGKQIIAVVNFPSKQIANIHSECLVLGLVGGYEGTVLLSSERKVENGLRVG